MSREGKGFSKIVLEHAGGPDEHDEADAKVDSKGETVKDST